MNHQRIHGVRRPQRRVGGNMRHIPDFGFTDQDGITVQVIDNRTDRFAGMVILNIN